MALNLIDFEALLNNEIQQIEQDIEEMRVINLNRRQSFHSNDDLSQSHESDNEIQSQSHESDQENQDQIIQRRQNNQDYKYPFQNQSQRMVQSDLQWKRRSEKNLDLEQWDFKDSPLNLAEQSAVQFFSGQQKEKKESVLSSTSYIIDQNNSFKKIMNKNDDLFELSYILIISYLTQKEQQKMQLISKIFYNFYITKSNLKFKQKYYSSNFDSVIIKHPSLRSKFVEMIDQARSLVLLYRGTRDGFKAIDFRKRCADKGATLTIYRTESRKYKIQRIIGGFTDIPWSMQVDMRQQYKSNRGNSFLFKLIKNFGLKKLEFQRDTYKIPFETTHAANLMPSFISDLQILEDCHVQDKNFSDCYQYYGENNHQNYFNSPLQQYKYMTGEVAFFVKEIEVYKVIY